MKFNFRTEKIRDDDGNVIGTGRKHPEVIAPLPVPTTEQLVELLQSGGAVSELIHDAIRAVIFDAGKMQINAWREANPDDATFTASNFNLQGLTLEAIATMPKGDRKSSAISDEDWTAFLNDYHHVMVNIIGYEEKRVKLAMTHFKVQLRRIKSDKAAVQKLQDLLNLWASKTEALDDHVSCYDDLNKRAVKYINATDVNKAEAF
jgi:hypothetical protein